MAYPRKSSAGPRTVILGPNGAGKSVLMRLCHGLLRPDGREHHLARGSDAGAAAGDGVPAAGHAAPLRARQHRIRAEARRRRTRGSASCARATCWKRSGLRARCGSARARALGRRAAAARARTRVGARARRSCFSTSRRRISIPASTREVESIIGQIRASGTKIVMTTHNLGQARRLGGRDPVSQPGPARRADAGRAIFQPTRVGRSRRVHPRRVAMELNRRNLCRSS